MFEILLATGNGYTPLVQGLETTQEAYEWIAAHSKRTGWNLNNYRIGFGGSKA